FRAVIPPGEHPRPPGGTGGRSDTRRRGSPPTALPGARCGSPGSPADPLDNTRRSPDPGEVPPGGFADRPRGYSRPRGDAHGHIPEPCARPPSWGAGPTGRPGPPRHRPAGAPPAAARRATPRPPTTPAILPGPSAEPPGGEQPTPTPPKSKPVPPAWIAPASTSIRLSTPDPPTAWAPSTRPVAGSKSSFSVMAS